MTALWLAALLAQATPPATPAMVSLGPKETAALAQRLASREPFLDSAEARTEKATLNRFFGPADYRTLRGNPILGYWDPGGFRWQGQKIAWRGISAGPGCRRIAQAAWEAAFRFVATKRHLRRDPRAQVVLEGACVWAVVEPSAREPVPGVLLEVRVTSPSGTLRYRLGMGKPAVEDAIGAALDFLVAFAMATR